MDATRIRFRLIGRHVRMAAALLLVGNFLAACAGRNADVDQAPSFQSPAVEISHSLIPIPASVDLSATESIILTDETQIIVEGGDSEAARIGRYLADLVGNSVETTPDVVESGSESAGGPHIRLTRAGTDSAPGGEAYDLVIASDAVTLTAPTHAGLFYGVQTIRHLLPPYVEYGAAYPLRVEGGDAGCRSPLLSP